MLTALLTSAGSGVVETVRATIMREKQSRIAQQSTLPSRARCSVMSVHHYSLGLVAVNRRLTKVNGGIDTNQVGLSPPKTRQPTQALFGHDRVDEFVVGVHVIVGQQRRADPAARVGAAGTLVDLGDGVGHYQPSHLVVRDGPMPVVLQQETR